MFSIQQPLLVFSDLDGTLLDSHSYDWQPAAPWLSRLREANVPVILCSSKTSAEMLYLQKMLGLQGLPLIAENGAVIQLAEQWQEIDGFPRIISGISHGEISQVLNTLREKEHFKFTTFDDVDDATIAEWTGLSRSQAALTQLHEASVTLIWRDSDERTGLTVYARCALLARPGCLCRKRSGCQLDYRDLSTIVRQTPNHTWPGRWAKRCALTGGNGLRGDCERAKP
ncbi:phosphatase [Escherichia coli DEC5B]|nr:phosphatase [Escherichia coli DEC5B]